MSSSPPSEPSQEQQANRSKLDGNRIVKLITQSIATKIMIIGFRLGKNIVLARLLGPADRGLFALISSLPDLIGTIANLGYSNSAAYSVAQGKDSLKRVLGATLAFTVVISIILIPITYGVIHTPWLVEDRSDDLQFFAVFILLAIPLVIYKIIHINVVNADNRVGFVNAMALTESALPIVLFFILWLMLDMSTLDASVYAWIATLGIIFFCLFFSFRKELPYSFSMETQKQLADYGIRGHFDTLFQKLLLRIDFIFISALLGSSALGQYAMATAAAELLLAFPQAVAVPLFSFLLGASQKSQDQITPIALRLITCSMIVLAIFLGLFGDLLIHLLFGKEYLPAYEPLLYLLPGIVLLSYCSLLRLDMLGKNRPGAVSIASGSALLVNIILNLVLIPEFGIAGAAMASTLSYLLATIMLFYQYQKLTGLSFLETILIRPSDIRLVINSVLKRES